VFSLAVAKMTSSVAAFSKILETRCFFYCLKEHCHANLHRIRNITRIFRLMRQQLFGLQEHLKYCSPLGGILKSMRRTQETRIGPATIRRLEMAGITSFSALTSLTIDQLVQLGVRRKAARMIRCYLLRRSQ
jgi:helicase